MVNNPTLVWWRTMLTEMLDAPIAKLTMSNQVDVGNDLFNRGTLLVLDTILEDVLNDKTTSFTQSHLVPHTTKSLVDFQHDLWWFFTPAKFEELLPDVTSIAMNNSIWDTSKQFMDHVSFVFLGHRIKGLLDDMTAKWVHAE